MVSVGPAIDPPTNTYTTAEEARGAGLIPCTESHQCLSNVVLHSLMDP